jgi:hypothetical protein
MRESEEWEQVPYSEIWEFGEQGCWFESRVIGAIMFEGFFNLFFPLTKSEEWERVPYYESFIWRWVKLAPVLRYKSCNGF